MQSTLRGIVYFLKIKTEFTQTRAGNYAIHAERVGFFLKLKPSLHGRVLVIISSTLRRIGYFFKVMWNTDIIF